MSGSSSGVVAMLDSPSRKRPLIPGLTAGMNQTASMKFAVSMAVEDITRQTEIDIRTSLMVSPSRRKCRAPTKDQGIPVTGPVQKAEQWRRDTRQDLGCGRVNRVICHP